MSKLTITMSKLGEVGIQYSQVFTIALFYFPLFLERNVLDDLIPLDWLNMSKDTYKVHCKRLFLNCNSLLPVV